MVISIADYLSRRREFDAQIPLLRVAGAGSRADTLLMDRIGYCNPIGPRVLALALAPSAIDLPTAMELTAVYAEATLL